MTTTPQFVGGTQFLTDGLCAQTDPETFFPERGTPTTPAKRICRACPVQDACLEYALVHDERFGVWGGTSPIERRALRRERGIGTQANAVREGRP
jgi:WhiB family transcriptional regulator, redox-sensing transcriptional regulator